MVSILLSDGWMDGWADGCTYRVTLAFSTFLTRHHDTTHIRNHHMSIDCQLSLKGVRLATADEKPIERTLNIWRIPLRPNFQAAMVSLSFFAWKSRETEFLPLFLMTLLWIPATVLRLRTW